MQAARYILGVGSLRLNFAELLGLPLPLADPATGDGSVNQTCNWMHQRRGFAGKFFSFFLWKALASRQRAASVMALLGPMLL